MLRGAMMTLFSQVLAAVVFFAAVIGPFLLFRFDIAASVSGAMILAAIIFIYWPRAKRKRDRE